jgi:hypothetical protein
MHDSQPMTQREHVMRNSAAAEEPSTSRHAQEGLSRAGWSAETGPHIKNGTATQLRHYVMQQKLQIHSAPTARLIQLHHYMMHQLRLTLHHCRSSCQLAHLACIERVYQVRRGTPTSHTAAAAACW